MSKQTDFNFGFNVDDPPPHDNDDDPAMLPKEIDVDDLVDFIRGELKQLNQRIRERVKAHGSNIQWNDERRGGSIPRSEILEEGNKNRGRNLRDIQNGDWDELQRALENTRKRGRGKN
jgi:hypothetical protein